MRFEIAMLLWYSRLLEGKFPMLLQQLRIDALHNALVETDLAALRIHLILLARWGPRLGWYGGR